MALFNLTDISFKPPGSAKGPLASLTENQEYMRSTYRYPSDLGSSDKSHYMVININVQSKTKFNYEGTQDTPTAIANQKKLGSSVAGTSNLVGNAGEVIGEAVQLGDQVASTIGNAIQNKLPKTAGRLKATALVQFTTGAAIAAKKELTSVIDNLKNGSIRAQKRVTDTIALYMPDTLLFTHNQNYENISAGGQTLTALAAAGYSVVDALKGSGTSAQKGFKVGQNLSPFILSAASKAAGGLGQIAFTQGTGLVQNPMLELLYSSPEFRTFRFDFQFNPRDEKESKEVQDIIKKLRFHQAPEIETRFGSGFFMLPPSEFDISFYYNGKINPNIPEISTCVLTSIDIDYAPNGFSAYEVPGQNAFLGGTGMPVAIKLSLEFKETEILTKSSIGQNALSGQTVSNFNDSGYNQKNDKGQGLF
jgi:hypothetical protein